MGSLVGYIDTCVSWLERTEWGKKVTAAVGAALIALGTWIATRYPPVWLAVLFVILLWMLLDIEARLLPRLRRWLNPSVQIEVSSVGYADSRLLVSPPVPPLACFKVRFPIYILNESSRRRVSLRLGLTVETEGQPPFHMLELPHDGITLNLGPGEETSGEIVADGIFQTYRPVDDRHVMLTLKFLDRLSDRKGAMHIPGTFKA